ncbi:hypothetical protein [Georgenia alba]|uniref:Outer membrane channel protein CpnT-like N-terminal domain-containing protein n=1 Tax=Georgenia alba TaxID=2233858 RepID=A0ABW2Q4A0_9MICO
MGINIPGELSFVLDLLGYEWPDIDEDELQNAAVLLREYRDDLEQTLLDLDTRIDSDLNDAFVSQAGLAMIQAWQDNRTQNTEQVLEVLPGAADGVDALSYAVLGMKTKVIVELTITAAQIAAAVAAAVFTGGMSMAAQAAIIAVRKKALDIATELAVEVIAAEMLVRVMTPLQDDVETWIQAVLTAPVVTPAGSPGQLMEVDYTIMTNLADLIEQTADEQEALGEDYAARLLALPIFTA